MNAPKKPEQQSSPVVGICGAVFVVTGLVVYYNAIAPSVFGETAERGFNFGRIIGAGIAAGVCAAIGFGFGFLIEKLRK